MVYSFPQNVVMRPTRYVGRNHTYIYFPVAWTDTTSGTKYESGYYNEDGKKCEDVAFAEEDGSFKNVLCECEYCGTRKVMDVEAGGTLQCEACGGTMKIVGNVEELIRKETIDKNTFAYDDDPNTDYESNASLSRYLLFSILTIFAATIIFIGVIFGYIRHTATPFNYDYSYYNSYNDLYQSDQDSTYPETYNEDDYYYTLYLQDAGESTFEITDNESNSAKTLTWYDEYESYYDEETDCYLWYNEDFDPPVWQYWYEGISSDYGNYGWMEYDEQENAWYIEADYDQWIKLPEQYDTSRLWHIR